MITISENIKQLFKDKGVKPTPQRLKIFQFVYNNKVHPTVEAIYRALVKDLPTISRTTVYNTLKYFVEKGIIFPVTITGTELRFDADIDFHHHFLCEKCSSIIDIPIESTSQCPKEINGHIIKETHSYFKGVCSKCRNKKS